MSADTEYELARQDILKHFVAKKMLHSQGEEFCPHCEKLLRYYEGLRVCYCKYCGGKIER